MNNSVKKLSDSLIPVVSVIFLAVFLSFLKPDVVMAQPIPSITYNFSGYSLPAGRSPVYTMDSAVVSTLLTRNPDGTLFTDAAGNHTANTGAVANYVATIAAAYNIPGAIEMNQTAEVNYLTSMINAGLSDPSHTPAMNLTGNGTGVDYLNVNSAVPAATQTAAVSITDYSAQAADIAGAVAGTTTAAVPGATYIDVDLTNQKLIYVVNGVPALISDVVTGNVSGGHDTPVGTFAIYSKQTDRTLKGPGYSAYVHYWMPFYQGYGLHDANWRGSFGGNIYKTNGSHGCVNLPPSMASTLFATVNVGTPVIVHY